MYVITIVGAESSGKTMLAKQLAEAYGCPWVPEYAREYLEQLGRPYAFEDLEQIARGQWELQQQFQSNDKRILIVDGGILTIKMWARIKYEEMIPFVEELMDKDLTSLYLLCRPRREWEFDPLREAPSLVDRVWIYQQYLDYLQKRNRPFQLVQPGPEVIVNWKSIPGLP
ncbi:MAG TPA: ATP-binding protein [Saprospiraceae bacterium]|nr:ATP-binding protein [Saprospiraceae bacterium]